MQPEGNFFDLGFNHMTVESLTQMYAMITSLNAWNILARRDVPGDGGFVQPAHTDPDIQKFLESLTDFDIPLFGFVMRQIENIAKNGWYAFVLERRDIVMTRQKSLQPCQEL
jgi:hypothetical protein